MRKPLRAPAVVIVLGLVLGACQPSGSAPWPSAAATAAPGASAGTTPTSPSVLPVIITSQPVVGPGRFVFSFLDSTGVKPLASPDRKAAVAFVAPGETEPSKATVAQFIWAIKDMRGDYVIHTDFASAGSWKAIFITEAPGSPQEALGVAFEVAADGSAIAVGEAAPASKTPTLVDAGGDIKRLSTDLVPDPAFYKTSVADALARRSPFVLAFATPAFCKSAQCGPTLELVKAVAKDAPSIVTFINVEPYQLTYAEGRLQPVLDAQGQLQPVTSVDEWGILTEPWIYTVDRNGIVSDSFEGVVSEEELRDAVEVIARS
jgi:hypothetical protein